MRLWLDRSVMFRKYSELSNLCRLAQKKGVAVTISAQVYLEDRRQTGVQQGAKFSPKKFDEVYAQLFEVVDVPFDRTTAARWADRLAARYPTKDTWREAKMATLGGQLHAAFEMEPARLPMTTDWWVALAAEDDPDAWAATQDQGEEWRALRNLNPPRAFTWEEATTWLTELPDVGGSARVDLKDGGGEVDAMVK